MKRRHLLLAAAGLLLVALPFRTRIQRGVVSLIQTAKGRRTVEQRVEEFAPAVQARLAPEFARIGITAPPRQLVLVGLKAERSLEVWVAGKEPGFKRLKTYPILAASGTLGPKLAEGDRQVPEGIYDLESLNPNSLYHLALRVGYPGPFDREQARVDGRTRLGSDIMIHGKAASVGCLAMGDPAIEELFVLAATTGITNVRIILSPVDFRRRELPPGGAPGPAWVSALHERLRSALREFTAPDGRN